MAGGGQDNARPLTSQEMAARQEESLKQKVNGLSPRFAAKFKEDTQGIRGLKQPPSVKLVSKEGKKFWVSRRILVARCPGLKLILEEKGDDYCGPVEMTKLGSKTLEVLIQYLEDGTLHPEWRTLEVIPELCEAAKEYELSLLFEFLEESLVDLFNSRSGSSASVLFELVFRLGMETAQWQIIALIEDDSTNIKQRIVDELRRRRQLRRRLQQLEAKHRELQEVLNKFRNKKMSQ